MTSSFSLTSHRIVSTYTFSNDVQLIDTSATFSTTFLLVTKQKLGDNGIVLVHNGYKMGSIAIRVYKFNLVDFIILNLD